MKTLTIKQPYASLIVEGYKEYEFRTWKTNYRGRILIHAGKGIDKETINNFKPLELDYPNGYIIGSVEIVDCIKVDDKLREELKKSPSVYEKIIKNKDYDGYAFKLANPRKIKPIEASGKLSFWEYNYPQE